jgi:hypothetical protein
MVLIFERVNKQRLSSIQNVDRTSIVSESLKVISVSLISDGRERNEVDCAGFLGG